jgi:hypothetical protein
MKEKFIPCDCGVEVLRLIFDPDEDWGLNISILEHHNIPWSDKLRWIYKILREGTPFEDEMILDADGVKKLIEFGEEYLNQLKLEEI